MAFPEIDIAQIIASNYTKTILEKKAASTLNKISDFVIDEWEKFKIDFNISFNKYLKNSFNKYSKIKTLLYRTEPQYIYDFFEVPMLEKKTYEEISAEDVNDILDVSQFVIIQGTGGIGKSTLMKHLFINEISKKDLIPVFIELKDINDIDDKCKMEDIIFEKLTNLGSNLNKKYLEYALKSGCFLFLLDGYDELISNKKDIFFKQLDIFCDKFSDNYFIISSRPYSEFIEFQRFTVLKATPLSKNQAISLIKKIEFDINIKKRFIKELDDKLYDSHMSFASNPLLLNIMLMTYDNYAEIPEKLHLFYANAFETLYSKHDATKAGYKRELRCKLSYDSFKKVFSYFCFITYIQGKIELSYDDLSKQINKVIKLLKIEFNVDAYLYDLINALCVLYKEGINYKFTHRSFQEYFTALFLKELADDNMEKVSKQLLDKDIFRVSHDDVFNMLYDMAEERFEKNILLPILRDYENKNNNQNQSNYDFYLRKIVASISFTNIILNDNKIHLILTFNKDDGYSQFIYHCVQHYIFKNTKINTEKEYSDQLFCYLKTQGYGLEFNVSYDMIKSDSKIYELLKETWIGQTILILSTLRNDLERKQKSNEIDLYNLLN